MPDFKLVAPFEPTVPPAVFVREPDPIPDELFAALPGTYEMGAIKITIEVRGHDSLRKLVASGTAMPAISLGPYRGRTLRLEGVQDGTATATLDADGRVTELVLLPTGVFLPTADEG